MSAAAIFGLICAVLIVGVLCLYLQYGIRARATIATPPPFPALAPAADVDDWRQRYSNEQERFDKLRKLFERQRNIDDHSPAARGQELRDIEKCYLELCPPAPTRRAEP